VVNKIKARTFNRTFESVFKSEKVFCDFRSSSLTSFFVIFGIEQFSKFPNIWKTLFPNFFWIFSELFEPKTGFFASKTQTSHTFFQIFQIYVHFRIISKLLTEVKFPNFFTKISRVQKLCFFSNFDSRTFPKLAKTKSLENSV